MTEVEFEQYLIDKLGLGEGSKVEKDAYWNNLHVDMLVQDKNKLKIVLEIASSATIDKLALLNLYKNIMPGPGSEEAPRFVLAAKHTPLKLEEMAARLGIEILQIPGGVRLPSGANRTPQGTVRITSEKSWKVISGLIARRSSSVRNLSITQNVSYGWAHANIRNLIAHGIVKRSGNLISVSDMDKLLNGVAWERPIKGLVKEEYGLPHDDVFEAARDLTKMFDGRGIQHAFASYIAGTLYAGQSVRFDSLQVYVDPDKMDDVKELIGVESKGSKIKVQVLAPDRSLFDGSRLVDGIRVTSPSQTLLDLAGLGYKGKDLTKALVVIYGQL